MKSEAALTAAEALPIDDPNALVYWVRALVLILDERTPIRFKGGEREYLDLKAFKTEEREKK